MSNVLRLAIVDPSEESREQLKRMLLGMDTVWLEAESSRYEFFADIVHQTNPDVAVVDLDANTEQAISLITSLRRSDPDCCILAVSQSTDGQLILRTMRAGAREFLNHPITVEELAAAFERLSNQRFGGGEGKSRSCQVIAVAGAAGGVGSTSAAVNLACVYAADESNSVVLVDLDLSLGDADVFLDTIPDYTMVDVAQNVSRLDFTLLKRSLTKHASGLYLLPRPVQLQDTELITPESLQRVLGLLKATFSHLIIDLSKGFTPLDMSAMEAAHQVLLITQLDLPCLRNIVRLMMSFEEVEGLKDKTRIVVNRVGLSNGQISLKKAQETIGCEIFWQLPNDYRTMVEVRNNGVPLLEHAPRAGITQAFVSMAEALSGKIYTEQAGEGEDLPAGAAKGGNWLKFWGNRGKPGA